MMVPLPPSPLYTDNDQFSTQDSLTPAVPKRVERSVAFKARLAVANLNLNRDWSKIDWSQLEPQAINTATQDLAALNIKLSEVYSSLYSYRLDRERDDPSDPDNVTSRSSCCSRISELFSACKKGKKAPELEDDIATEMPELTELALDAVPRFDFSILARKLKGVQASNLTNELGPLKSALEAISTLSQKIANEKQWQSKSMKTIFLLEDHQNDADDQTWRDTFIDAFCVSTNPDSFSGAKELKTYLRFQLPERKKLTDAIKRLPNLRFIFAISETDPKPNFDQAMRSADGKLRVQRFDKYHFMQLKITSANKSKHSLQYLGKDNSIQIRSSDEKPNKRMFKYIDKFAEAHGQLTAK